MREALAKITPYVSLAGVIGLLGLWLGSCYIANDRLDSLESDIGSVKEDVAALRGLESDVASIRNDISDLLGTVGELQPAPAVLGETAPPGTAAEEPPTPAPRLTGQASIIGDDRAGEPMFCDGKPYDPQANVIAVATTVQEQLLPCGSVVRVYRQLAWSNQPLEENATVTDTFRDPAGFDVNSDSARKFNLSRATANALEIYDGFNTVTVELMNKGDSQ